MEEHPGGRPGTVQQTDFHSILQCNLELHQIALCTCAISDRLEHIVSRHDVGFIGLEITHQNRRVLGRNHLGKQCHRRFDVDVGKRRLHDRLHRLFANIGILDDAGIGMRFAE